MTVEQLHDVVTGEVIPVALTAAEARALTDRIRQTLHVGHDLIVEAFRGSAWSALGYKSWDAYCAGEFAGARMVRLDREQRREIVAEMRQAGMSSRAIASGLGVSQSTGARDVRRGPESDDSPAPVTGLDGKTYQPPARPDPEPEAVTPAAPRRKPLPTQVHDAGWDLRRCLDRLERLAADDRFTPQNEQMATHLRGHLTHAIEVCQDLLDRVNTNSRGA